MFFIIGFVGRVGSSYLQGLLNSHPDVQCMGEILSREQVMRGQDNCRRRLDRLVHTSTRTASGFKLALSHIQCEENIIDVLRDHNYRAILLTRRNKIDQYISMRLAQLNGIWRSDAGTYRIHSFTADPQQLRASIHTFMNNDALLSDLLRDLPLIRMTYEELTTGAWCDEALQFLGVPYSEMISPFARQRRATRQRDALENYDELARYFKGTEIESHISE